MGSPSDEELLHRIAAGDTGAFELLYDRYARSAYSLAFRVLGDGKAAEDVVQDAFLRVWRMAGTFDSRRGLARSWLLGTVHHRAVDFYRKARGRPVVDLDAAEWHVAEADDLWDTVIADIDGAVLRAALAQLPPEQREAIELAYFGGFSHTEIAERCRLPLGTVKSRIRIGMDKLRQSLKGWRAEPKHGP